MLERKTAEDRTVNTDRCGYDHGYDVKVQTVAHKIDTCIKLVVKGGCRCWQAKDNLAECNMRLLGIDPRDTHDRQRLTQQSHSDDVGWMSRDVTRNICCVQDCDGTCQ